MKKYTKFLKGFAVKMAPVVAGGVVTGLLLEKAKKLPVVGDSLIKNAARGYGG